MLVGPVREMRRPMSKMCHQLAGGRRQIVTRSGQNSWTVDETVYVISASKLASGFEQAV
jgi:hypothetical protein